MAQNGSTQVNDSAQEGGEGIGSGGRSGNSGGNGGGNGGGGGGGNGDHAPGVREAALIKCTETLVQLESDLGLTGPEARKLYEEASADVQVLDELVSRFLETRRVDAVDCKGPAARELASSCAVCHETLGQAGAGEELLPASEGPTSVRFDCGHTLCLECATGMLRAKKDDSPDAVNLLTCPCARLELCEGVLFLQETQRVAAALEVLSLRSRGIHHLLWLPGSTEQTGSTERASKRTISSQGAGNGSRDDEDGSDNPERAPLRKVAKTAPSTVVTSVARTVPHTAGAMLEYFSRKLRTSGTALTSSDHEHWRARGMGDTGNTSGGHAVSTPFGHARLESLAASHCGASQGLNAEGNEVHTSQAPHSSNSGNARLEYGMTQSQEDLEAQRTYEIWRWYQDVVQGYALRCACLFPCTSPACAAACNLVRVPPAFIPKGKKEKSAGVRAGDGGKGGEGGAVHNEKEDTSGELLKATATCDRCGLRICGACTWKARRLVGFHAPLPCAHRVAVEACVTRVQKAIDDLEQKRIAAALGSRGRSGRERQAGSQESSGEASRGDGASGKSRREEARKVLPTCVPTISEMIELLEQLGRTSEVTALRAVEAGTYQPPAAPGESSAQLISRSSKPCPTGCGWDITKDKGCNHMTCKKCGHKFCWKCLQERPRESDAHDCPVPDLERLAACLLELSTAVGPVPRRPSCADMKPPCAKGAPDVLSFDPKVQDLIRRVLKNYDPAVETNGSTNANPLVADATVLVNFAAKYLQPGVDSSVGRGAKASGGDDDESSRASPDVNAIEGVQKVLLRLRKLWEGRAGMFEALAQEQEVERGEAAANAAPWHHAGLHRRLQRRREEVHAMMMDRFHGDDFDAFDWRLRVHRRMQRREAMEHDAQRQARERDDEQRLLLRRVLLEQISTNLDGATSGVIYDSGQVVNDGHSPQITSEELEARVEQCAEIYAQYNHIKQEKDRVAQVRHAVAAYRPPAAGPRHPHLQRHGPMLGVGMVRAPSIRQISARTRPSCRAWDEDGEAPQQASPVVERAANGDRGAEGPTLPWPANVSHDGGARAEQGHIHPATQEPQEASNLTAAASETAANSAQQHVAGDRTTQQAPRASIPPRSHRLQPAIAASEGSRSSTGRGAARGDAAGAAGAVSLATGAAAPSDAGAGAVAAHGGRGAFASCMPDTGGLAAYGFRSRAGAPASAASLRERAMHEARLQLESEGVLPREGLAMAALPALQQMPLDLEEISRMEMIAHRALERSREIWREASRDIRLLPRPGAGLAASASLDTPPAPEAVAQDGMWQLKSLVLQVMDLNLASLEWNMCCKLVSLGQHLGLGLIPRAGKVVSPLVRLSDVLCSMRAKHPASADIARILCPVPRAMPSMLVDDMFRDDRLRSAALSLLPALLADERLVPLMEMRGGS